MSAKRKAEPAMTPDGEGRASKRARGLNGDADESPAGVTRLGEEFLRGLRQAKDKTGRSIAKEFLTLPSRDELPEYFDDIALPMALDMIEAKLRRQEYPTLTALESDAKRMIVNAKAYNDKSSLIYEDAERLRKTMSNWMTRYNPAYRDQGYVAVATPLPDGASDITTRHGGGAVVANGTSTPTPAMKKEGGGSIRLKLTDHKGKSTAETPVPATASTPAPAQTPSATAPAAQQEKRPGSKDFVGKTFSQAQDQIMAELIKYRDPESGLDIFTPFINLPSRAIEDYYHTIKHPVSLKLVQKKAVGVQGRAAPTGVSLFKSWDEFATEVAFIYNNCRTYNEDGSEMYNLANEFEEIFKERLADARAVVEEPEQPRLKIKMGAPAGPIKLRLNPKESPTPQSERATPDSRGTPGVGVDTAALERQKAHVAAAVNGRRPPSAGAVPPPTSGSDAARSASAGSPPALPQAVKTESQPPAGSMPPPSSATRVASGSPHPQAGAVQPPAVLQHSSSYSSQQSYPTPPTPASNGFERKYREAGKTAKDALLRELTLLTHPQLALPRPVRLTVPASPKLLSQSVTVTLPPQHSLLQITPHIPLALSARPYRLFVSVNGQRMTESVRQGVVVSSDRSRPIYEARLERGVVNRVEVEVLAAKEVKGEGIRGAKEGVEAERVVVFVHLLRA